MTAKQFEVLYTAQLSIGKLLNELCEKQYPGYFTSALQKEAEKIGEQLGGGYFKDCYWLENSLSLDSANQLYKLQHP